MVRPRHLRPPSPCSIPPLAAGKHRWWRRCVADVQRVPRARASADRSDGRRERIVQCENCQQHPVPRLARRSLRRHIRVRPIRGRWLAAQSRSCGTASASRTATGRSWPSSTAPWASPRTTIEEHQGLLAALQGRSIAATRRCTCGRTRAAGQADARRRPRQEPGLQPLHAEARALASRIGRVTFEHVRRERNRVCHRLANLATDEAAGRAPKPGEHSPDARMNHQTAWPAPSRRYE